MRYHCSKIITFILSIWINIIILCFSVIWPFCFVSSPQGAIELFSFMSLYILHWLWPDTKRGYYLICKDIVLFFKGIPFHMQNWLGAFLHLQLLLRLLLLWQLLQFDGNNHIINVIKKSFQWTCRNADKKKICKFENMFNSSHLFKF